MIAFIKYIQGYVYVELTGYAPERFLNLCSNRDILIWNLAPCEGGYSFCISVAAFRKLKPILRKTKTKIRIKRRVGLPFTVFFYRKRKFFVAGLIFCGIFLYYLSGFVWNIEINGNSYLSDETVLDFLKEEGCCFGASIREISCEELEEALRSKYDEVIWTSIQIFGTKMTVDIQENLLPAEQYERQDDAVYDIVAQKDGVISEMITRSGTPLTVPGTEVAAGDVLVSARVVVENDDGDVKKILYHSADADIVARVTYSYEDVFDAAYVSSEPTANRKVTYQLILGETGFSSPFFHNPYEEYYVTTETSQLHVTDNFYLPVFLAKSTYQEVQKTDRTYDMAQAKKLAAENLEQFLTDLEEKGIQIIEKNVMIESKNGRYMVTGTIDVYESIVSYVPADTSETTSEERQNVDESD